MVAFINSRDQFVVVFNVDDCCASIFISVFFKHVNGDLLFLIVKCGGVTIPDEICGVVKAILFKDKIFDYIIASACKK